MILFQNQRERPDKQCSSSPGIQGKLILRPDSDQEFTLKQGGYGTQPDNANFNRHRNNDLITVATGSRKYSSAELAQTGGCRTHNG